MSPPPNCRGVALPLALFVLVAAGALVSGTFFLGRLEQESGRNTLFATQAREAAEAAVTETVAALDAATLEGMAIGAPPVVLDPLVLTAGVSASRRIQRLTALLYLVRAEGMRQAPGGIVLATYPLGAVLQLVPAGHSEPGARVVRRVERGWFSAY